MGEELKFIVQALNGEPFGKDLTLVTFDGKSPKQLLQILQDVCEEISEDQATDLRDEDPEDTARRLFDFLWILKYKPPPGTDPVAFKQSIGDGESRTLYPILYWLLQRIPELRRRAYLSKFLLKLEVPADMQQDQLYADYLAAQDDFKDNHKQAEKIRSTGFQPGAMKKQQAELQQTVDRLNEKLRRVQKKLERVKNIKELVDAAFILRRAQEEAKTFKDDARSQEEALQDVSTRLFRAQEGLADIEQVAGNDTGDISAEKYLQKLQEELKMQKFVAEKIPKEVEEKKTWVRKLQSVVDAPVLSLNQKQEIEREILTLKQDVQKLEDKRAEDESNVDDKLAFYRQQFKAVEGKRVEKERTLKEHVDDKLQLEEELARKKEELAENSPDKMLKGAELDKFVSNLRGKSDEYKRAQRVQTELSTERGVLSRTLEILTAKKKSLQAEVEKTERERGVEGYQDTQTKLEEISAMKSDVDSMKGKTLEEISAVVNDINAAIKKHKDRLAPQIKQLRALREEHQLISSEYADKKGVWDSTNAAVNNERGHVDNMLAEKSEHAAREESRYHMLHAQMEVIQAVEKMLQTQGYVDAIKAANAKAEARNKELREVQREMKDTQGDSQVQIEMLTDLKVLLERKAKTLQKDASANSNRMSMDTDESDRMVL